MGKSDTIRAVDVDTRVLGREVAQQVYNMVVANHVNSEQGACWVTARPGVEGWQIEKAPYYYNGTAGILDFILQYNEIAPNAEAVELSDAVGNWLIEQCDPTEANASLHLGSLGIALVLARLNLQVRREARSRWIRRAIANTSQGIGENPRCELLGGVAGVLQGLLAIRRVRGVGSITDTGIIKSIGELSRRAVTHPEGCYWDYPIDAMRPLCGISHGVAGVAGMLEVAQRMFPFPGVSNILKLCWRYEASCYSESRKNWADFRVDLTSAATQQALLSQRLRLPNRPNFPVAWCHGAVGELFARGGCGAADVRRHEATATIRRYATENLNKTRGDIDYTLCHGLGGAIEFLACIRDPAVNADEREFSTFLRKVRVALHSGMRSGTPGYPVRDYSLLTGLAGVGWVALRLSGYDIASPLALVPVGPPISSERAIQRKVKYSQDCSRDARHHWFIPFYRRSKPNVPRGKLKQRSADYNVKSQAETAVAARKIHRLRPLDLNSASIKLETLRAKNVLKSRLVRKRSFFRLAPNATLVLLPRRATVNAAGKDLKNGNACKFALIYFNENGIGTLELSPLAATALKLLCAKNSEQGAFEKFRLCVEQPSNPRWRSWWDSYLTMLVDAGYLVLRDKLKSLEIKSYELD